MIRNVFGVYTLIGIIQKHILHLLHYAHTVMDTRLATCSSHAGGHSYILKPLFNDEMWNLSHACHFVQDFLVVLHLNGKFQEISLPSVDISIYVFLAVLKVPQSDSIFLTSLHCLESKYINLMIPQQGYVVICDVHWIYSQNTTPHKTRHEHSDGLLSK